MKDYTNHNRAISLLPIDLERAFAPIAGVFRDASADFGRGMDCLGAVTQSFGDMASVLESDDVSQALSKLDGVARAIGGLNQSSHDGESNLEAMKGSADRLAGRIDRLSKTFDEVKILAINAKVEAAHVNALDVDFGVFTEEIDRLAGTALTRLGQLSKELSGLQAGIGGALNGLTEFSRVHAQSLSAISGQLSQGLDVIGAKRHQSAEAIRALGDSSRRMTEDVGQGARALRIGDITRQRAEQIGRALETLQKALGDGGDAQGLAAPQQRALTAMVCRLQGAEAAAARAELQQALSGVETSLKAVGADGAGLPNRCLRLYGAGSNTGTSFLLQLDREFDQAGRALGDYGHARANVAKVVAGISSIADNMVDHIEAIGSIEADMWIMGLNATFKCGRLGNQGHALRVIAQELRKYSNRTGEDGRGIMTDLTQLIDNAKGLSEYERLSDATDTTNHDLVQSVQTLGTASDRLDQALSALTTHSDTLSGLLEHGRQLLSEHTEFADALAQCEQTLATIAGQDEDEAALREIPEALLRQFRARYTKDH